jgi:serine/threonine protein kinase
MYLKLYLTPSYDVYLQKIISGVKPSNILVDYDGSIKLCNFGISKKNAENVRK